MAMGKLGLSLRTELADAASRRGPKHIFACYTVKVSTPV